jgi:AI-2 transport protein TqsA
MNPCEWTGRQVKVVEATAWVLLLVLLTIILKTLAFIFIPLSIALMLSYVVGIPLEVLRRWRVPATLRIVVVVLVVAAGLYLMAVLIQANVSAFVEQFPEFEKKLAHNLRVIFNLTGLDQRELERIIADLPGSMRGAVQPFGGLVQRVGGSFFSFVGNLFWVLLFMVFILAERESIAHRLVRALGGERSESLLETIGLINKEVQHFLGYKVLISFATGVVVTLTLWLFEVPFALLWGSTAFVLNLAPYVGSIIASIPPIFITLFESGSLGKTVVVGLVITTIQMTIGSLIEPLVMGRGLDLSPLLILLALIFWGWMWGVIGMLLAIPIMAAIKIALAQIESTRFLAVMMSSK